nr:protein abnormal spindle [Leptinotarsa decemlineata]
MFFQFSPVRREKNPIPVVKENESEKIENLLLAPFTPTPKLFFDNIRIGDTAARQLLIKNPTDHDITLFLSRPLPEEINVSYNWIEKIIGRYSEEIFEIRWKPMKKESVRHTITFKDFGKIQKDVYIAFTSIPQNKTKENKVGVKQKGLNKKSPTKKYYSTRPTKISPAKCSAYSKKCSPLKHYPFSIVPVEKPLNTYSHYPLLMADYSQPRISYEIENKENSPSFLKNSSRASEIFVSPKNVSFTMEYIQPQERRGTFVLNENKRETFILHNKKSPKDEFDDSLENASPIKSPVSSFGMWCKRIPLVTHNSDNISASFQESSVKTNSSVNYGFEYKLNEFCFTPVKTPLKSCENVTCTFATGLEKIHMEITPVREISPQNRTYELPLSNTLNVSTETYIKSNTSGDTYVKENTSFETYVKDNISSGTYTKESSVEDIHSLSISPLTSKVSSAPRKKISPTYRHRNINQKSPETNNIEKSTEVNVWTGVDRMELSRIEEESYVQQTMRESIMNFSRNSTLKRKSDIDFNSSCCKKICTPSGPKDWSKKGSTAFRVAKKTSGLNLSRLKDVIKEENLKINAEITKKDTSSIIIQNPFILAATNLVDPFMTSNLYVNNEWIDQQEKDFKKWLNSLLTPPEELSSEERVIDVAKVWQECKKREVDSAPTKEVISSKYHTNKKLNNLRETAQILFKSREISKVLCKVMQAVDAGKLNIRKDKDVHLNLSLKSEIITILLSYNSLWLRIGLETIYNEEIPLNSNSDIVGLSTFIANRLLKDPYLIKKYKSIHLPKYTDEFNKFFLKKFLILVYFLDQAKNRKLISHDPCLFCKNSTIKESKEILLRLARETLSAVGDITKFLKYSGYIVTHSQTYIHEFDYAVNSLGVDLRDGVRLTKVMEIILMRNDLSEKLRVPAISRLQKIHNMKIVFDSLENAGYNILYDITPKDIVDGHKEKTLSFLWQIIYKFEAPLMVKSATTIQKWFRSLPVVLKRRKLERIKKMRENAASKIQNWYRRLNLSQKILHFVLILKRYIEFVKKHRSAIKIQSCFRKYFCEKMYKKQIKTIIHIQSLSRGWLVRNVYRERIKSAVIIQSYVRMYLIKKKYIQIKRATLLIQSKYRAQKQMKMAKYAYEKLRFSVTFIQRKFRANRLALKDYEAYQKLKFTVITIQRRFRANKLCKKQHDRYLKLKSTAIFIQTRYRSMKTMQIFRSKFLALKQSVLILEERFIALKKMRMERERYLEIRGASISIQQYYRAWKLMLKERSEFLKFRKSVCIIQQAYRAKIAMHYEICRYETLRSATIFIQRKCRANILMRTTRNWFLEVKSAVTEIQIWFRAILEMKKCRSHYVSLKHAVCIIEDRYQANLLMKKHVLWYQQTRSAIILIQHKYRAQISMRLMRNEYKSLRLAVLLVQRKFRSQKVGRLKRSEYLKQRQAAIVIQRRYRAQFRMRQCRQDFMTLKLAAIVMQRRFKANIKMKKAKYFYLNLREKVVFIQRVFRANTAMKKERENYQRLRKATVIIQRKWKATVLMRIEKKQYINLRNAILVIQKRWHAKKLAEEAQAKYKSLIKAVVNIQRIWRANKLSEHTRFRYIELRMATIVLQQRWRAKKSYDQQKQIFQMTKNAVLIIQNRWRSTRKAVVEQQKYRNLKTATILIQRRWRANKLAQLAQENYKRLRNAALCIQLIWRAKQKGKIQRNEFMQLKKFTIIVQTQWRAKIMAKQEKTYYDQLKKMTLFIQHKWIAKQLARKDRMRYNKLRSAIVYVQNRWRATKIASKQREHFSKLRKATVIIQRRWRVLRLGQNARKHYVELRHAVLVIQRRWRANKTMKEQLKYYSQLKHSTILLQRKFRANLKMKMEMNTFVNMRSAVISIQRYYRGYIQMKKARNGFLVQKNTVVGLQRYIRGYLVRRKYAYYFTSDAREERKLRQIQMAAANKIQSFWRGYKCRSSDDYKFKKIRQRFKTANANAVPEKSLEWKCKAALETFANTSSTLFHIINALKDIDFATRRCKKICLELGSLLPDQLYIMLSATSRSLPEMKACIFSVNILISFCKFPPTRQYSFVPEYIDNLVNVMLHWCDKESQLFPNLCTLFWLFAHTPKWKRFILNLPNLDIRLKKVQSLVSRKESMVKRSITKGVSHFETVKNLPMPSLNPDWGLDYKNKPNVFTNSIHAFASLSAILNM